MASEKGSGAEGLHVDKEKVKEAFDLSHFDVNTVIRGAQLTLVGGKQTRILRRAIQLVMLTMIPSFKPIEPFRTPPSSQTITTARPPWLLELVSPSDSSSPFPWVLKCISHR